MTRSEEQRSFKDGRDSTEHMGIKFRIRQLGRRRGVRMVEELRGGKKKG